MKFSVYFSDLPDPRIDRCKRHLLTDILTITLCAMVANAATWVDIADFGTNKESWLRSFLNLPNGIPSHDTFARVFARLDPTAFQTCFRAWVHALGQHLPDDVVAIDGKTLRRTHDAAIARSPIHLLSAWLTAQGLVLGQL